MSQGDDANAALQQEREGSCSLRSAEVAAQPARKHLLQGSGGRGGNSIESGVDGSGGDSVPHLCVRKPGPG